eukprot:TRINITY_DN6211_c0_g1_i1.p1 TRINITY_DN6211_c0_g1~~TRINITY_DN6211_c0_g1_i1.p1  ORF type:complete len:559 (-),score=122.08 TRINITY_DN6211_c0_g1_i1:183-1859(-)
MSTRLVVKTIQGDGSGGSVVGDLSFEVLADAAETVGALKLRIASCAGLPSERVRLVSAGQQWLDPTPVGSYAPLDGATVFCVTGGLAARAGSSASASQVPGRGGYAGADARPEALGASSLDPSCGSSPSPAAAAAAAPSSQALRAGLYRRLAEDPEMLQGILQCHPRLSRLMEEQPAFARLMGDPEHLRRTALAIANPSLRQEMTRAADTAIGRLDVMPGGRDALVQAYREISSPLYEALGPPAQSASDASTRGATVADGASLVSADGSPAAATAGGPNRQAMPNPWFAGGGAAEAPAAQPAPTRPPSALAAGASTQGFLGRDFGEQGERSPAALAAMASVLGGARRAASWNASAPDAASSDAPQPAGVEEQPSGSPLDMLVAMRRMLEQSQARQRLLQDLLTERFGASGAAAAVAGALAQPPLDGALAPPPPFVAPEEPSTGSTAEPLVPLQATSLQLGPSMPLGSPLVPLDGATSLLGVQTASDGAAIPRSRAAAPEGSVAACAVAGANTCVATPDAGASAGADLSGTGMSGHAGEPTAVGADGGSGSDRPPTSAS